MTEWTRGDQCMGVGFSFDFRTISQNILRDKPLKYRLDKWMTVRCIENWLNCLDHRVVTSGVN